MAVKPRIEIRCPHCNNLQWEPEAVQSTNCRSCGSYIHLEKGQVAGGTQDSLLAQPPHRQDELKARTEVTCPSCSNRQPESASAKSTYCRKCGQHIQLDRPSRPAALREPRERTASGLQKLQDFLGVQRTIVARCFECPGVREVPKTARSTLCPKCGAYIDLQDYKIAGAYTRSIRTGGRLFIGLKGDLISRQAYCGSGEIEGSLRANLLCSGDLKIKRKGKIAGEIQARNIYIDRKSEAEFTHSIRAELIEIDGAVAAPSVFARRVVVNKTGRLTAAVTAQGLVVEKGGYFAGDLTIGEPEHLVTESSALASVADAPAAHGPQKPVQERGDELVSG